MAETILRITCILKPPFLFWFFSTNNSQTSKCLQRWQPKRFGWVLGGLSQIWSNTIEPFLKKVVIVCFVFFDNYTHILSYKMFKNIYLCKICLHIKFYVNRSARILKLHICENVTSKSIRLQKCQLTNIFCNWRCEYSKRRIEKECVLLINLKGEIVKYDVTHFRPRLGCTVFAHWYRLLTFWETFCHLISSIHQMLRHF